MRLSASLVATETERIVGAGASMSREAVGEDEAIDRGNEKESVCSLSPSLLGCMKDEPKVEGFCLGFSAIG